MIRFDRFPEGKTHVVALSFDDGRCDDLRLAKLLNKYLLKATFHINSGKINSQGYLSTSQVNELSKVHEVALHSENHARLINCASTSIVQEVLRDRLFLENELGRILKGFSYPFGDVNDVIYNSISACGIQYARTTSSTHNFNIPNDFNLWNPTCHIYEMPQVVSRFLEKTSSLGQAPLLLVWGHSFELERDNRWNEMETLFSEISNREEIWYATCGEIYSYIQAVRRLQVSADETMVTNPSFQSVWISYNKNPFEIRGGEEVRLE
ncbi:polysaccharide deacetylase [Lacrimispora xylanolytica]